MRQQGAVLIEAVAIVGLIILVYGLALGALKSSSNTESWITASNVLNSNANFLDPFTKDPSGNTAPYTEVNELKNKLTVISQVLVEQVKRASGIIDKSENLRCGTLLGYLNIDDQSDADSNTPGTVEGFIVPSAVIMAVDPNVADKSQYDEISDSENTSLKAAFDALVGAKGSFTAGALAQKLDLVSPTIEIETGPGNKITSYFKWVPFYAWGCASSVEILAGYKSKESYAGIVVPRR